MSASVYRRIIASPEGFGFAPLARGTRVAPRSGAQWAASNKYNTAMNRKTRTQPINPAVATEQDGSEHGYDRPSKSQLKRDMLALQVLGVALIELPKDALKRMPMPEKLDDAVRDARKITDHEGKRRQVQYVGRVMRSLTDEETAALRTALDTYRGVNRAETAKLHWIEHTREKLLADDSAFTDFIRQHPGVDPQEGRTLIRNARKEREQSKPPRYFRELFQWIKTAAGVDEEDESAAEAEDGNEIEFPQRDDDDGYKA